MGTHKEILDSCFNRVADLFDVKMASTMPWKFQTRAEYHFCQAFDITTTSDSNSICRASSAAGTHATHRAVALGESVNNEVIKDARERTWWRLITCFWSVNIASRLCLTSFWIDGQIKCWIQEGEEAREVQSFVWSSWIHICKTGSCPRVWVVVSH